MPVRLIAWVLVAGCAPPQAEAPPAAMASPPADVAGAFTKEVSFAILQDYAKGHDLRDVERDFELMKELGVRTWRGSLGWDDYEPERDRYDFARAKSDAGDAKLLADLVRAPVIQSPHRR